MPPIHYTVELGLTVSASLFLVGVGVVGVTPLAGGTEDGVVWTDISADVLSLEIARGRQDELSSFNAGWCRLLLRNDDGAYSPENTASAYYPNIRPMKRVRVSVTDNGLFTTDYLFYGWIESWRPVDTIGTMAKLEVRATDLFLRLKRVKLNDTWPAELSGTRVGRVLDKVAWPNALRSIDAGIDTVTAETVTDDALTHLEAIRRTEDGQMWGSGDGTFAFRDRHARFTDTASVSSRLTFGPSNNRFRVLDYEANLFDTYPTVEVTRTGGTAQSVTDSSAEAEFGANTLSVGTLHETDGIANAHARWLLASKSQVVGKLKSVTLNGTRIVPVGVNVQRRDVNDRVTVVHTANTFGMTSKDFWVEGVRLRAERDQSHEVQFYLTAADPVPWMIVGHASKGLVGSARVAH